jgi:D-threo-aldose 1-dehydrogenase
MDRSLTFPRIIFGTSCLGNLYRRIPDDTKNRIVDACLDTDNFPVVFDSAGKYGAGLALESLGRRLSARAEPPQNVLISNKLGWYRVPLSGAEPGFEPGVWAGLENDAEQRISAEGILECYEQGLSLLGGTYGTGLVSVHDPDEYLSARPGEHSQRTTDILEAYASLAKLKRQGKASAIGIGAKDWRVILELCEKIDFDWVMTACSLTIHHHTPEIVSFFRQLELRGIKVINSAVFHSGFLTGGEFFDYHKLDPASSTDKHLFEWRSRFHELCNRFDIGPDLACVQFGLTPPAVVSVALNTSRPEGIAQNRRLVDQSVPPGFWRACKDTGLVDRA